MRGFGRLVSAITALLFVFTVFGPLQGLDAETAWSADRGVKKIAAGTPSYKAKDHKAWRAKGRIVGVVKGCPGCEVKALDATTKKVVKACTVKQGGKTYELEWLKPGKYILLVTASGYQAHDVHNLVVKAKNDLRVDLEF